LWIITFITSIPARFFLYAPVLDHEGKEQMASDCRFWCPWPDSNLQPPV
jgi:hypothetical protein